MSDPHDDGEIICTFICPADPPDPPENLGDLIDAETKTITVAKGCVPFIQIERGDDGDIDLGGWQVEYSKDYDDG